MTQTEKKSSYFWWIALFTACITFAVIENSIWSYTAAALVLTVTALIVKLTKGTEGIKGLLRSVGGVLLLVTIIIALMAVTEGLKFLSFKGFFFAIVGYFAVLGLVWLIFKGLRKVGGRRIEDGLCRSKSSEEPRNFGDFFFSYSCGI